MPINLQDVLDDGELLGQVGADLAGVAGVYRPGGTDVPVVDGGTGASTAGAARTNLGLGSIATQAASNVAITGGSIAGITDLALADGGTGASSANEALTNLTSLRQLGASRMMTATQHPALFALQRAWATRASLPLKMVFLGDSQFAFSFVQRSFATAMSDIANPPNRQLATWSASGTIVPGDETWGVGGGASLFTSVSGSLTQADKVANRGRSGDALAMANGETFTTPAITCTSFTVRWLTPLSGAGATLTLAVDGVAVAAPSSAAAGSYDITDLPDTAHTLTVTSNGVNLFDCIDIGYGNETSGFRPYTIANTGEDVSDFNSYTDFDEGIAAIDPACVVIEPFTNYAAGSAATMFTDLTTLIETVRANCRASIVLAIPNATLGDTDWPLYTAYVRRAAQQKNCYLIEVGDAMPDLSASAASWSRSGTTVTVTLPQHHLRVGDTLTISASSATTPLPNAGYTVVTTPTADTFTITGVNSGSASGTATATRTNYTSDGVHYDSTYGRPSFGMALFAGLFGGRRPQTLRGTAGPLDVYMGPNRDERRFLCHFESIDAAITADGKIPGTGFYVDVTGAGAQVSQDEIADTREGVAKMTTGTTASGACAIFATRRGFTWDSARRANFGEVLKTPILSTATEQYNAYWGFLDSTATPDDGVFFRQSHGGTNYECVTRLNGTETASDSGVAIQTAYRSFYFDFDPLTGLVSFYIGNALVAQQGTNLPVAQSLRPEVRINGVAYSAVPHTLSVDLMSATCLDNSNLTPLFP